MKSPNKHISEAEYDRIEMTAIKMTSKQYGKRRFPVGLELADIHQAVRLGVFRAAQKFDPSKGVTFMTYGVRYAQGYAQRAFDSGFRVGGSVAWRMGESRWDFEAASLDAKVEEDGARFEEFIPDPTALKPYLGVEVEDLLNLLDERERIAIQMRICEQATLEAVGVALGVSKQGAANIVKRAIEHLREMVGDQSPAELRTTSNQRPRMWIGGDLLPASDASFARQIPKLKSKPSLRHLVRQAVEQGKIPREGPVTRSLCIEMAALWKIEHWWAVEGAIRSFRKTEGIPPRRRGTPVDMSENGPTRLAERLEKVLDALGIDLYLPVAYDTTRSIARLMEVRHGLILNALVRVRKNRAITINQEVRNEWRGPNLVERIEAWILDRGVDLSKPVPKSVKIELAKAVGCEAITAKTTLTVLRRQLGIPNPQEKP